MQANSIAQAEVKVIDDLQKMKEWLDRAQDHANRQVGLETDSVTIALKHQPICQLSQLNMFLCFCFPANLLQGGLDLQYLSTRFQRGKEWGGQFVQSHHMFAVTPIGIQDGHVELLKYQNQSRADGDTADMCLAMPVW